MVSMAIKAMSGAPVQLDRDVVRVNGAESGARRRTS